MAWHAGFHDYLKGEPSGSELNEAESELTTSPTPAFEDFHHAGAVFKGNKHMTICHHSDSEISRKVLKSGL
jgi:hypothetical protein